MSSTWSIASPAPSKHTDLHILLHPNLALFWGLTSIQLVSASLCVCHTQCSFCTLSSHPSYACPCAFLTGYKTRWASDEYMLNEQKKNQLISHPELALHWLPQIAFSQSASHVIAFLWHLLVYLRSTQHALVSSSCLVYLFPIAPGPTVLIPTRPNTLCGLQSKPDAPLPKPWTHSSTACPQAYSFYLIAAHIQLHSAG